MESAIRVSDVNYSVRSGFWMKRVPLLNGVSFEVPTHSIFGILGSNGAGKTTLIQLVAGLKRAAGGSLFVLGKAAHSQEAKSVIGYLPERPYFYEHLTGEKILRYYGALSGFPKEELSRRVSKVLSLVGLEEARNVELRRYSKGMLQRIGIAQALIHDPIILVLDEPMSGLDPSGRRRMLDLMAELQTQGKTVVFSSHVISDVEAICTDVLMIEKGRIVASGPLKELQNENHTQKEIGFLSTVPVSFEAQATPLGMKGVAVNETKFQKMLIELVEKKAQILWVKPLRSSLERHLSSEEKSR